MGGALVRSPFVGREVEWGALEEALEQRAERPGLLVSGEAGIGKTRLLDEFAAHAAVHGVTVSRGGCLPLGAGALPFAPFVEALGRLREALGADDAVFGGIEAEPLAALLPEPGSRPAPEQERIRLYEAVRTVFDRVPDPTLLILEDIQWADRSSLELLSYLVRRLRHGRTLVVASFRGDEASNAAVGAALAELGASDRAGRLGVAPLRGAALEALVRAARPEASAETLAAIVERSDGNPFFAHELGVSGWQPGGTLPPTLRDLLLVRVRDTAATARQVLELLAVAGRPIGGALLEALFAGSAVELDEAVAQGIAHGLLVNELDTTRIEFHHELVGDAVREGMAPLERATLHARLAGILSERPELGLRTEAGRHGELARHWLAAERMPEALRESVRAADAAARLPAWAEAYAHCQRALSLWDLVPEAVSLAGTEHAGMLDRAANAAVMAGDPRAAVALQRQSIEETDPGAGVLLGSRYGELARWLDEAGQMPEAIAAAERAFALVSDDHPGPERASALFTMAGARMLAGRYWDAVALARQACEMAMDLGLASVEACARAVLGVSLWCVGDETSGLAELRRAVRLAERSADSYALSTAHSNLCWVLAVRAGDASAAAEALRTHRAFAERHDTLRAAGARLHYYWAAALFAAGRWDECLEEVAAGLSGAPEPMLADDLHAIRGRIRVARGLVSEGEAELRATIPPGPSYDAGRAGYLGLTEAAFARGQPELVLDIIGEALSYLGEEDVPAVGHLHVLGLRASADLAEASTARRDPRTLEFARGSGTRHLAALDKLRSRCAALAGATANSTITRLTAWGEAEATRLSGRTDPALWSAAAQVLDGWIVPHEVAHARYRESEALFGSGQRAKAGDVLQEAHRRASALGLAPLLNEIASLARRGRLELVAQARDDGREASAADRHALSTREREVLDLLIEGRTNREIGARLFISEKTASVHVSHILDKLGVPTRGAAVAAAARLAGR